MSSGRTHALGSALATPFALYTTYIVSDAPTAIVAALSCGLLGVLITPDLDQEGKSWIENKLLKNRNPVIALFGIIHLAAWYPYAKAIPHRHFLSHFPIVGTLIRVCYFLAFVLAIYWYVSTQTSLVFQTINRQLLVDYGLAMFYGLAVSDTVHYIFDITSSKMRKMKKNNTKLKPKKQPLLKLKLWQ